MILGAQTSTFKKFSLSYTQQLREQRKIMAPAPKATNPLQADATVAKTTLTVIGFEAVGPSVTIGVAVTVGMYGVGVHVFDAVNCDVGGKV